VNGIPFVDLHAQYQGLKSEIDEAISCVIEECAFVGGSYVTRFAEQYAAAYGAVHCITVANGTDAIYIVLKMLGIGAGDEVITTASSWIATSETISQTGATPVFVDVDEYMHIDARKIEQALSPRTRAILPVHLYGQPVEVDVITDIAERHGLHVVEDCAQAHFAEYQSKRVGLFGIAGTFSFFPGKNLGAYGDAGAIITDDFSLAESCRMFANHGARQKHEHEMEGINSRLDGIQAAILSIKLKYIHQWTEQRRAVAAWYDQGLAGISQVKPLGRRKQGKHVFHLYVVKAEDRDGLRQFLMDQGVQCGIHYPAPLPLLRAYDHLGLTAGQFPKAVNMHHQILSLPVYPEMTEDMVNDVVAAIQVFYEGSPLASG